MQRLKWQMMLQMKLLRKEAKQAIFNYVDWGLGRTGASR